MADQLEVKEVIKNTTVTEFKAFNPTGYETLVKGLTVTELQLVNPDLINSIVEGNKITELSYNVGNDKKTVKITELQILVDGYENTIAKIKNDMEVAKITEYKNRKIGEQVPENLRERIGSRVIGNTEADIDKSLESEMAYIREMGGLNNIPAPRNPQLSIGVDKDIMKNLFGVKETK